MTIKSSSLVLSNEYRQDKFLPAVNMVQKGLLGDIQKVTAGINGSPNGGPVPIAESPANRD